MIQARKLEKPYKDQGKKLPPKVEKQVNELLAKVSESITPKQKPFEAELEKHGLQLNRTDFLHYPESGSIQVTPKQNSNLEWKNKERGDHGLKGSAKYREQALEKLSEKSYIDRLEPATKAQNPLTQLHGLKYEILKDLYKAKRYAKQGDTSYETYTRYASRASDELDIIEQTIRELKNAIVPKPKRTEQVRSKVQDFIKWRDEVRFDVDYLLGLESDGTKHALEYLRDLLTPTKHHASFVKDLQEQIHKHFDTDPTPPTPPSTPTPADTPKVDSSGESTQTPKEAPKLESNLNHTLESYKAHETATTKLKNIGILEKENELKDLVAEKEKVEQRAETIKAQAHSRTLTKIAGELEEIGFDTFSKRPVLDYEAPRIKKINPRLDGQEFYDESTIIKFKDLKKFIKSRDDFIKFKNKLDTLYLVDRPYGSARYLNKIKDFSDIKQARFYQAFSESNYDNIKKELIDKEASKVKNIDNDKIISLQKELNELKEQLEKTNQSLAHSQRELEQIPFLQKLFNNKPLFNDFLALRFNTMSEKELKKEAQKALIDIDISRSYFEKALNITPIKDFGTNYAEHYHSGESAIAKLLLERQGQVAGAFHRDELGDIDLVWGEVTGSGQQAKGWGLAKIIEKHGDEFQDIAKELDEIIRDGEVVKRVGRDEAYNIEYNGFKVGINKGFNKQGENKWIVTAFGDNVEKTAKTAPASDSTKGADLSLNSSDIIAQDLQDTPKVDSNALLKSAMKKFAYDEKKAKDLLEWHKDSHPLTKDKNGLPKVFYHGTSSDKVFEVFNKDKIHSGYGFWFGDDIADRAVKENTTGKAPIIKAFLQMKKPFIFSNQGITAQNIDEYAYITGISKKRITELYEAKEAFNTLEKMIQRDTQADYVWAGAVDYFEIEKGGKELNIFDYRQLDLSDQTIAFLDRMRTKGITARGIDISPTRQYESAQEARETLERLKEKGYDSMVYANSEFVVFDSNQIKHIENRGVESESGRKYFNDSSPNIFHSNPHLGAGLLGGSVAGVEQDENGQWRFSPEKFALGLLGSTAGSKAVSSGKYAIMRRMEAKKQDKRLYNVFKAIDSSAKYGSKMNLIGKENLNAETLAYALARNKRFAINKLDEKVAKELGFKYPQDVRRSIDPNNVAHTLNRHGEQSNLVKFSGQKPVTLDEIAKYQDYADNATHKGISIGKRQETASISARQLDGEFYVVVEQIQKGRNELGFKTMYFERRILDDEKFNKLLKK